METQSSKLYTPDSALSKSKEKNQNIQVFVRVRPMNTPERVKNSLVVLDCPGNREVVVKERSTNNLSKTFTFDRVFGPHSKQIDVYKVVVAPLLEEVLLGYNCTVFAYGQTGTGKTFTMEGERSPDPSLSWENDPLSGIVPRALGQLFDELRLQNVEFTVRVSLLELYNEELFDLLAPTDDSKLRTLRLFEDSTRKGSVIIQGLEEVTVHDKQEVYAIMERGSEKRQTAATQMNANSSRSHTVFTVTVHIKESNLDGEELLKIGKLHLVDLAGSENIGRSGAVDKRAREAGSINQSLLTLGRVITSLVERAPHVPYRESKLTRLLQDSLGGRTKTSIIATVSPASINLEETLSTLDYAHRAKNITNRPEINQKLTKKAMLKAYTEEIERLKRDLIATREKNGVYVDKENYENMMCQLESQGQELSDKIGHSRALQENLDLKEEEIVLMKAGWEETKDDLTAATELIQRLQADLSITKCKLVDVEQQKEEQEHLVVTHVASETKLSSEASALLDTAKSSTLNLETLYNKLERKKNVEHSNLEEGRRFRRDLSNHMNILADAIEDFRVHQATFCAEQRMKLDAFLQNKHAQCDGLNDTIEEIYGKMKELLLVSGGVASDQEMYLHKWVLDMNSSMDQKTESCKQMEEDMRMMIHSKIVLIKTLLSNVQSKTTAIMDKCCSELEFQTLLVDKYVHGCIGKLEKHQQRLDEFLTREAEISAESTNLTKAQQMATNKFFDGFQSKACSLIAEMHEMIAIATEHKDTGLRNSAAIIEQLSNSSLNVNKFATDSKNDLTLHNGDNINFKNDMNEKTNRTTADLRTDVSSVSDMCEEQSRLLSTLQNGADDAVSVQQESWMSASNWLKNVNKDLLEVNTKEFVSKHHLAAYEHNPVLNTQKERVTKMLQGGLDSDTTMVGNVKAEVNDFCLKTSDWAECNRAYVHHQSGMLSEFWDSTYLIDLPTGMTPQRKVYQYPLNLTTTSPHEHIIQRFRQAKKIQFELPSIVVDESRSENTLEASEKCGSFNSFGYDASNMNNHGDGHKSATAADVSGESISASADNIYDSRSSTGSSPDDQMKPPPCSNVKNNFSRSVSDLEPVRGKVFNKENKVTGTKGSGSKLKQLIERKETSAAKGRRPAILKSQTPN